MYLKTIFIYTLVFIISLFKILHMVSFFRIGVCKEVQKFYHEIIDINTNTLFKWITGIQTDIVLSKKR